MLGNVCITLAFAAHSNALRTGVLLVHFSPSLPLRGKSTGSIIKVIIRFSGTAMGSLTYGSLSSLTVCNSSGCLDSSHQ